MRRASLKTKAPRCPSVTSRENSCHDYWKYPTVMSLLLKYSYLFAWLGTGLERKASTHPLRFLCAQRLCVLSRKSESRALAC